MRIRSYGSDATACKGEINNSGCSKLAFSKTRLFPHGFLQYLSISLPSKELNVNSSPMIAIFPLMISGEEPMRVTSNRTLPFCRRKYLPVTDMPSLSTALKVPSFQNSKVAVFPTSRHFPIKLGVDKQDTEKINANTTKTKWCFGLNFLLCIGFLSLFCVRFGLRRIHRR